MLHQLMKIKQHRERGLRNELAHTTRLRQQVEQEISLLQQHRNEIKDKWQLACLELTGVIDHKVLIRWSEHMHSYQLKYEAIGQQISMQQQIHTRLTQEEIELQGMLRQVLRSQDKINYMILEGVDN
ncbi:hypothetical protein CSM99_001782 [Salmonella enterica subsp. diarizonae]|nr:hypothetical protein [Salmonella enterica]EDV2891471.1 hypothetical protein [Salmonella enterica subsp. diarizonae]